MGSSNLLVQNERIHSESNNHTLFIKHTLERKLFVLIVHVDDIIITGNDIVGMSSLNKLLIKSSRSWTLDKSGIF